MPSEKYLRGRLAHLKHVEELLRKKVEDLSSEKNNQLLADCLQEQTQLQDQLSRIQYDEDGDVCMNCQG